MAKNAYLGGGCFWCLEAAFKELDGVKKVSSGYAGGYTEDPSYREVCSDKSEHAEVVKITYDESEISYEDLLSLFFKIHDPTTENREGPDIGNQYRSIILYENEEQKKRIEDFIEEERQYYSEDIVTEVKPLEKFWPAEEKHQNYYEKNPDDPYCRAHVSKKVKKAEKFEGR